VGRETVALAITDANLVYRQEKNRFDFAPAIASRPSEKNLATLKSCLTGDALPPLLKTIGAAVTSLDAV